MTEPRDKALPIEVERWLDRRPDAGERLEPLLGDVSPRRYFRLHAPSGEAAIVAFYPEGTRDAAERFRRTTELLAAAAVPVPETLDWDPDLGVMLVGDAGRQTVHDAVAGGRDAMPYWRRAVPIVNAIARLDPSEVADLNPVLDATTLRREVLQSLDLVLEPRGLVGEGALAEDFRLALGALCDRLAAPAPRPCHRDFMARNLLLDDAEALTVIDHQDLRLGPPWYDLASLLNDTLYATPRQEAALLALAGVPDAELELYHRAAAQRALKIVGTFAAFANRGVERYLWLVPPSLVAARRHLERLPETAPTLSSLAPLWQGKAPEKP